MSPSEIRRQYPRSERMASLDRKRDVLAWMESVPDFAPEPMQKIRVEIGALEFSERFDLAVEGVTLEELTA